MARRRAAPLPKPSRDARPAAGGLAFAALYVEGPRDREILRSWAWRVSPGFARAAADAAVILGGRQPDRARRHLSELRARDPAARGLCILDRDSGDLPSEPAPADGLETFVWSRRHIESYLLVPAAIRRALPWQARDSGITRVLADHLPPAGDEQACLRLDAKRILGPAGALARWLGRPLDLGRIARETRDAELHDDVRSLLELLREGSSWQRSACAGSDGPGVRAAGPAGGVYWADLNRGGGSA